MAFPLITTSNINGLLTNGTIQPILFNGTLKIYNIEDISFPGGVIGLIDNGANSISTLQSNNSALYYNSDKIITLNYLVSDINSAYTTSDPDTFLTVSNIEVLGYGANNGYMNFSNIQGSNGVGIRYNHSNNSIEIKDGTTVMDWATIPDIVASTNYLIDLQDVNINTPLNNQYLTYNYSSNLWINSNLTLSTIVNLSSNNCSFQDNLNISILEIYSVPDAVNYIQILNSTTGTDPIIKAMGSDSNIGIEIQATGTGDITLSTIGEIYLNAPNGVSTSANLDVNSTASASTFNIKPSGYLVFNDTTGNTTTIQASTTFSSNISLVLPIDAGTSNTTLFNDGSGNLSWNAITGNSSNTEILFNNNGIIDGTPVLNVIDTSNLIVITGSWLNFGSSNCNISGDNNNLYITSNYGNIELNAKIIIEPQTDIIIPDVSVGSGSNLNIISSAVYISITDIINNYIFYTLIINSVNTRGQMLNIFFDNSGTNILQLDFGINGLATGSGLARYLGFNTSGQSAQLMFIGGLWRLTGCGCGVL